MADIRKAIVEAVAAVIGEKRAPSVADAVLAALGRESPYLSESDMNSMASGEASPCDGQYCHGDE